VIHHVHCLQTEGSLLKNLIVEKDLVRFGVTMVVEFEFDLETFSMGNGQPRL
jgi:hypothetical protein